MPYSTWRYARKQSDSSSKKPRILLKNKPGYILCPDNVLILEYEYQGDQTFDKQNIFDLVVRWNKPYMKETVAKLPGLFQHPYRTIILELAHGYQTNDYQKLQTSLQFLNQRTNAFCTNAFFQPIYNWKRWLGYLIATEPGFNKQLPYPIKVLENFDLEKPIYEWYEASEYIPNQPD